MSDTIKETLGGRKTVTVATLIDNTQPDKYISLSLRPDVSEPGTYSVVAKKGKHSESFRMRYGSNMTVKKAMRHFEDYLNAGSPGQFKVIVLEPKPPKSDKPKPDKPKTQVDVWKAKLKQLKRIQFKTAVQENEIEHLKRLIKADPAKFAVGNGVGWQVTRTQTNRGYRIVDLDPANKMAEITSVADTGITITGGKDKLPNQRVPIGDLLRDKKYDAEIAFEVVTDIPKTKERKKTTRLKPLPPEAIYPQILRLNSTEATCYGKETKRGYRVYCRIKK